MRSAPTSVGPFGRIFKGNFGQLPDVLEGLLRVGNAGPRLVRAAAEARVPVGADRPKLDLRCRSDSGRAALTQPLIGPVTGTGGSGRWAVKIQRQQSAWTRSSTEVRYGHIAAPRLMKPSGSNQPEAASISPFDAGPSGQVAGHAALRDTSGQGAHQAPDSVLRRR